MCNYNSRQTCVILQILTELQSLFLPRSVDPINSSEFLWMTSFGHAEALMRLWWLSHFYILTGDMTRKPLIDNEEFYLALIRDFEIVIDQDLQSLSACPVASRTVYPILR